MRLLRKVSSRIEIYMQAVSHRANKSWRTWALGVACLAILAGGAWLTWLQLTTAIATREPRVAARASVPVTIAIATRRDLPVYLTGLGTVQASYTVAIHSQIDGKLQEVNFVEGQQVNKGDLLAKVDPRLFQA